MKSEWFKAEIRSWDPDIDWSDAELKSLSEDLLDICRMNRGVVLLDKDVPEHLIQEYSVGQVESLLNRLARIYAESLPAGSEPPLYARKTGAFKESLPFMTPSEFVEKLNLNTATDEQLERLPGIGEVTAGRIVELRRKAGGAFKDIVDLKKAKGIGNEEIAMFKDAVYIQASPGKPLLLSSAIRELRRNPTFRSYVRVIREGNVILSRYSSLDNETLKGRVMHEVRGLRTQLERLGRDPQSRFPGIRASGLEEREQRKQKAEEVSNLAIEEKMQGAIINDAQYPFFVGALLKEAKDTIRIIMFFMRFEDEKNYPTDALFDELLSAKKRDVNIKIILDRDAEGDAIGSRVINDEAYRYLRKRKIAVVYDSVEKYTHTKLVVIDRAHVVIGSHNWTAGSFFNWDDTSVYVHSPGLGAHYYDQFERLWEEYNR